MKQNIVIALLYCVAVITVLNVLFDSNIAYAETDCLALRFLAVMRTNSEVELYLECLASDGDAPVKLGSSDVYNTIVRFSIDTTSDLFEFDVSNTPAAPMFATKDDVFCLYNSESDLPVGSDMLTVQVPFLLEPADAGVYAVGQDSGLILKLPSSVGPIRHGVCDVIRRVTRRNERQYINYYKVDEFDSDLQFTNLYSSYHDLPKVTDATTRGLDIPNNHIWHLTNIHRPGPTQGSYYAYVSKVSFLVSQHESNIETAVVIVNPETEQFVSLSPYLPETPAAISDNFIVFRSADLQAVQYIDYSMTTSDSESHWQDRQSIIEGESYGDFVDIVWVNDQVFAFIFRNELVLMDLTDHSTLGQISY